jgi:hypothetical protein
MRKMLIASSYVENLHNATEELFFSCSLFLPRFLLCSIMEN